MTVLVMLALATAAFADDMDFTTLRFLAVQKDGRKKPLDTVALETVEKLTGKKSFTDPESGRSKRKTTNSTTLGAIEKSASITVVVVIGACEEINPETDLACLHGTQTKRSGLGDLSHNCLGWTSFGGNLGRRLDNCMPFTLKSFRSMHDG